MNSSNVQQLKKKTGENSSDVTLIFPDFNQISSNLLCVITTDLRSIELSCNQSPWWISMATGPRKSHPPTFRLRTGAEFHPTKLVARKKGT